MEVIIKCLAVFGLSMLKFLAGPILGINSGLSFLETIIFTILGMMASVFLFTNILGDKFHTWILKTFNKNPKLFTKKNRRKVRIWRAYGLKGVAFLTPVIFSPIGGAIVANSFGESRKKIYLYMFLSSVFWSVTYSLALLLLRENYISLRF
jgi:uncharacterized membrane protein